jgi:hypothetical protein
VRKPLDSPNVASNVLRYGTGALNVDGCRVGLESTQRNNTAEMGYHGGNLADSYATGSPAGRWPANLVLSHSEGCRSVGVRKVRSGNGVAGGKVDHAAFGGGMKNRGNEFGYADPDGTETISAWECAEDCPVAELDRQSGDRDSGGPSRRPSGHYDRHWQGDSIFGDKSFGRNGDITAYADSGGATRFFPTFRYEPKASTAERNQGLSQSYLNKHPTVKSVELMRWLCRLVTPKGGTVLDPFMGSGSTGVAAKLEGFQFIGIEKDAESYETARRRLEWAVHEPGLFE